MTTNDPPAGDEDLRRQVVELVGSSDGGAGPVERTAPSVRPVRGDAIPQPYRDLLMHTAGMTGTLEAYWKQPIGLRPVAVRREGDVLVRQIVLVAGESARPVGFGAIRIHLDRFDERARPAILASRTPLGTILREQRIDHKRRLTGLFEVGSEALARGGFELPAHQVLYGRHTVLLTPSDQVLAEVVEILPPA